MPRTRRDEPITLKFERDGAALGAARHAAPSLVLPLESTVIEVSLPTQRVRVDRASFVLMPASTPYTVRAVSPAPRLLTLGLSDAAFTMAVDEYAPAIDLGTFHALCREVRVFARTRWVDELAHRYLYERHVCDRHHSAATVFLETELCKELFFLGQELLQRRERASVLHEGDALARRAQQVIEEDLFTALRVDRLAKKCHTSVSTLLRAFRREFKMGPAEYIRTRRLDEALLLLESGRYSVGEVATRVGYDSASAFSAAFAARFNEPPSRVRTYQSS